MLKGNCCYGKTATNQERHPNINVASEGEASRHLDVTDKTTYEVESAKKVIKLDLPIQISFFVYNYAKLCLLQFCYDFIGKYLYKSDYELCFCDTDSLYLAISGENIDELVKPELKEEYQREKERWFPRHDTLTNAAYDKRTPLLWKVEFEGDGVVALNSKTYYCYGEKDKFSCK